MQIACILLGITGLLALAFSKFTSGRLVVIITGLGILGFFITLILLTIHLKAFWPIVKAIGKSLLFVILGTYVILFIFVYFFQDTIANQTSSFFQPKTISSETAQALVSSDTSAIDLVTPDGFHLRGWMVHNATGAKSPLIIYFGGSGSESSELIPLVKQIPGWSVALINYRGFGRSEGVPTQSNVLNDAVFIYDTLSNRPDIDASQIVSMGHSLGTGVATYLSGRRPTMATILVSPYDHWSLIGVKQSSIYTPIIRIMKPYFNSIAIAPGIKTPALILIGSNDTFVPPERSQKLADSWGITANQVLYQGEDHGLLFHTNSSWSDIKDFLDSVK
jgi:pimeloyl-ACP methyl ester carboxylesterase